MEIASIIHNIGTILGFGGAVFSAVLMLRLRTDEQRLRRGRIARRIAPITWCGFILLILSGVKLTLDYPSGYTLIFGVKHLCIAILLVDALFIHFRFFPRYFRQVGTNGFNKTYATMRNIGTLSMTCWIIVIALSILSMAIK
ncbi:hypothetical protein ACFLWB_01345 [Chloroflexota bacterium]